MKLRWSARAHRDLHEISDYIAADAPDAARRWIERLRERARKAADLPNAGRHVPELSSEDVREVFVRSYRIVYRIEARGILVLTVIEGHVQLTEGRLED